MLGRRGTNPGAMTPGGRATDRERATGKLTRRQWAPGGMGNRLKRRGCLGDREPTGDRVRTSNRANSPFLTCSWATTRLLLPSPWYLHSFSSIFPSSIPRCGPGASRGRELGAAGSPGHQPPQSREERLSAAAFARPSCPDSQARAAGSHAPGSSMTKPGNFRVRVSFFSSDKCGRWAGGHLRFWYSDPLPERGTGREVSGWRRK